MNKFEEADEAERIRLAPKITEHIDLAVGITTFHCTHGKGTIRDAYEMTNGSAYAQVEFEDGVTKEFRFPLESPWFSNSPFVKADENGVAQA